MSTLSAPETPSACCGEQLSPLLVMIVPMAYAIGYRQGKMSRARRLRRIASNQVKRVRRGTRERKNGVKSAQPVDLTNYAHHWRNVGFPQAVCPPGTTTRPTLDHVKESLFNILGTCPEGAVVLDLFAGSGAPGFEALSRGAEKAVFNDSSKAACTAIRRNAQTLGLMDSTVISQHALAAALKAMENSSARSTLFSRSALRYGCRSRTG